MARVTLAEGAELTAEQVKAATGARLLATAQKFLPFIIDTCKQYDIDTPGKRLAFLAQLGHESAGLYYTEELASGKAYEGRADLGNSEAGDGIRFKGRGLIQITGRANYRSLSSAFKVDFTASPPLLGGKNASVCSPDQLKYATLSAGWFWDSRKLNDIAGKIDLLKPIDADENLVYFKQITRKINGGYNGLSDRISRYNGGIDLFK
ncbi:glycoside hydrolase family 19 protein [Pedobacter sp. HMF7056]|uniref:Glycoside hydrolase family 19 protein n=1 Tax=Hufsiella ginkgonis TaxID=2695274 RepID=A0A7K1XYW5_9SPHI|nr:glycoside hydrolase family 19 protein [Hufsiella ginkgonis]